MHIAMLAPIAWRTPPLHYGPWESVVSLLTEGLVSRGYEVTLFATGDSITSGKLHAVCPQGYEEDRSLEPKVWECLHISELFEYANEFDIIHNHFDFLPLTYTQLIDTSVVTTIHGFSSRAILSVYKKYNSKVTYVAISDADRSSELDYIATIYHGINLEQFDFQSEPEDYLIFFGRIHHDKGVKEAIEIARACNKKLILAGIIQDEDYYKISVEPYLDNDNVVYLGSVDPVKRSQLLGKASALLHPINFNEPFGLSVIEAMACGTPVIAFNKGSMPELIDNGVNGFLVETVDEAKDAIQHLSEIDRTQCRRHVELYFTSDKMIENYIDVYEEVYAKTKHETRRPWGYYKVLTDESNHKCKEIVVFPGKRLSLQRHRQRSEHWYILNGQAEVTLDSKTFTLSPGQAVDIPKGALHRIANLGTSDMHFIEVQTGNYFGEDDIERVEDDFGRA
ncbi:MAG: glycosyltransferase [Gammaproteobacteria bacterium]|jgi:glycosyltransferase involved in cell wall biosynthesis|nr:glycosyltransferase [Gammaproteobacteria bacterium]